MKYIEYLYLLAAGAMAALLAAKMKEIPPVEIALLIAGIFVLGFMYSFRKMQRLRIEKMEKEDILRRSSGTEKEKNSSHKA